MTYQYNDGGRKAAGYKGSTGDCFVRAVAIADNLPYTLVYDEVNDYCRSKRQTKQMQSSGSRTGVFATTARQYLADLLWQWHPTMGIGTGCKVHVRADELPSGRLILALSRHYAAFIDGVVHDIYDCSRDGSRCVYGYRSKAENFGDEE